MDKQQIIVRVPCSRHISEHIQRVSTDIEASQHLFCLECVLQQTQEGGSLGSLKTIPDFIDIAAQFYSQHKQATPSASDVPDEYIGILSKQSDIIEAFNIHIANQKNIIESEFDALIHDVLQLLTNQKKKYMHALDQQLLNLRYWYTSFAKKIKKTYPTPEDISILYPSREDLVTKVQKITNDTQLTAFIRGIKDDIYEVNKPERNERLSLEEVRKKELSELVKQISELESLRPIYEMKDYNRSEFVQKIGEDLNGKLETLFELSNPISDISNGLYSYNSKIFSSEEYSLVRGWLEPKYRSRQPKLLYRGERDGKDAQFFHQKCDGKGPTLTLLKIQPQGKPSGVFIIGGFVEESWHSSDKWVTSSNSFLFSITNKVKCPILANNTAKAMSGTNNYGPVFGQYDLHVMPGFSTVNLREQSYAGSSKLINNSNASNNTTATFTLVEIEVYSL